MQTTHGLYGQQEMRMPLTAAVEKLTRHRMRIGTISTEGPRSTSSLSIASIPLLAESTSVSRRAFSTDAILGMGRSVFYARDCVQRRQHSPLGIGQSPCYPRMWVSNPFQCQRLDWNRRRQRCRPESAPHTLIVQRYRDFLQNALKCASSCEADVVV
jgi:hypothetical protein